MSNEFKHNSVGAELSQAEWEAIGTHIADGQVTGDILYFDGTYWKRRPYNIGARVYHNAAQSIPDTNDTILNFNSERWDTDDMHDTVTNNSRLVCKVAGTYLLTAFIGWAANATGNRVAYFMLNGATMIGYSRTVNAGGTDRAFQTVTCIYQLALNDFVEVYVKQNTGGALSVDAVAQVTPEFMMQRIG